MGQQLYQLIQSLTPPEKGYIKRASRKSNDASLFLKVMDVIAKQENYDEEKLLKKFSSELNSKNISKYKTDIEQLILKRLVAFHEEKDIELKLKSLLNQANVLQKKGLIKLAINKLEKIIKTGKEYEEHPVVLDAYQRLYGIYYTGQLGVEFPYSKEYENFIKMLSAENEIFLLNEGLAEIMFTDHLSEKKKIERIKSIQEAATKYKGIKSFVVQWGIKCIETHSQYLLRNHDLADISKKDQLIFLKEHPKIHEKEPMRHLKHLINFINGKFNISAYDEIPPLLKELEALTFKKGADTQLNILKWSCYYIHQINFYLQTGDFVSALKTLEVSGPWFEKNKEDISDYFLMLFYDAAFIAHFGNNNYKTALQFLNELHNYRSLFRKDLQVSVQYYFLVLHFELENFDLIQSKTRSLYRFLLKNYPHLKDEQTTLQLIKKTLKKVSNKSEIKTHWRTIVNEIEAVSNANSYSLMYIPFVISWLKSSENPLAFPKVYSSFYMKKEEEE